MSFNEERKIIDLLGILAVALVFFKVLLTESNCFSLLDQYVTILPLIFTKIMDLLEVYF